MKVKVIIHEAEEGGYWAEVPKMPGCVTQGDTLDELHANLREAMTGWLESMYEPNPRELVSDEELVEIHV